MSGAAYSKHLSALQSSNSQFFSSFSCGHLWHRFGVPTYERLHTGAEQSGRLLPLVPMTQMDLVLNDGN
ncbi:hypothetical protein [Mesorhizobium sp. WSM4904]|uniref:hypothetical protein n=1 Tax=Mesorhizobium sp. WSM4904 TaxID=3038545 RepID=UPI0024183056|nr:hypothetical protein [Mesorhizobium sp. WSM4904]WFP60425.1 hypothetical protein QAZ47_18070 [Mesorhizobium sp. WSM4904]